MLSRDMLSGFLLQSDAKHTTAITILDCLVLLR